LARSALEAGEGTRTPEILVHCPANGGLYAIPIEEATRTQGTLRVDPTANGQEKGVRWARDFQLPA
jgi:hypothetical protein